MSSQKYDAKIRKSADEALASVPAEHIAEATATRNKLYEWLHNVVRVAMDPTVAVAHSLKEKVCQEQGINPTVLQGVITEILHGTWTGGSLASKGPDGLEWVPTSFFYDPDTKALNVKVGQNPYQPIAYDDGKILVQLETAKLLWARSWAVCLAAQVPAPFDVKINVIQREDLIANEMFLSDEDVKGLDKSFQELSEELDSYLQVDMADKPAAKEADFRLRETLKLTRIWSPVLDAKLKQVLRAKSGLGPNFENAPIAEVAKATLEFAAYRKDAYLALLRQNEISLNLSPLDATVRQQVANECLALRRILTGEVIVVEVLTDLVKRICADYPFDADTTAAFDKEPDVISRAKAIYNVLAPRLTLDTKPPVGASGAPGVGGGAVHDQQVAQGAGAGGGDSPAGSDAAGGLPTPNASAVDGTSPQGTDGTSAGDSLQPRGSEG
jgi:hypothetical protein